MLLKWKQKFFPQCLLTAVRISEQYKTKSELPHDCYLSDRCSLMYEELDQRLQISFPTIFIVV